MGIVLGICDGFLLGFVLGKNLRTKKVCLMAIFGYLMGVVLGVII